MKEQHYIPKFYLKGFSDKQGRLWVYERFKPIRASKPKAEAYQPDYYTHAEKGERDETTERMLELIETKAAPVIRELTKPQYSLTPENAGHVIIFIAFMFARVPSWREHLDNVAAQVAKDNLLKIVRDKERFHRMCAEYEKAQGKALGMDFEHMGHDVLRGGYDLEQGSRAFNLGSMCLSAIDAAKVIGTMGYQALYAPEGKFFVTSDSPVYTIRPDREGSAVIGMGFGWRNVEVYCALNKRACFRLKHGIRPMGRVIEAGWVDQINKITMATATQYLYSSEEQRRIARLFDERGCKVRAGKNAFMTSPDPPGGGVTRL